MSTEPPAPRRHDRRNDIVVAAAKLFRQRGYAQVTISDIGAAVGFSGPAVYRYFAGKSELLEAVVASHFDLLGSAARARQDRSTSTAVDTCIDAGLRNPDGLVTASRQSAHLVPLAAEHLEARRRSLGPEWASLIPAGRATPDSGAQLRARSIAGQIAHVALARPGTLTLKRRLLRTTVGAVVSAEIGSLDPDGKALQAGSATDPGLRLSHATRREAVLASATELMSERGFTAVSLSDIGARAGITASAVMRHFASKEDLLAAAIHRVGEQIAAGLAVAIRGSRHPEEAVRRIVEMYAALAVAHRDVVVIDTLDSASMPARHQRERRRRQRMYVDELAHVIALAHPALGHAECRLRSGMTFALVNEAVLSADVSRRPAIVDELVLLAMIVAGVH